VVADLNLPQLSGDFHRPPVVSDRLVAACVS
jgi:hypothetical protein